MRACSLSGCPANPVGLVRWVILVWLVVWGVAGFRVRGGIPEPDIVWYGRVMAVVGGVPVRLTAGTLEWRLEPAGGGPAVVLSTSLASINDQFSYVLRVPCESPEPGVLATSGVVVLTVPAVEYRRVAVTLDGVPVSLQGVTEQFAPGLGDRGRLERIDLVMGVGLEDTDGNGLPDVWEQQYFGRLGVDPGDDEDGDGLTNGEEFWAGTDPTDPQSLFAVIEIQRLPQGTWLRWSSQAGRRYRVRRSGTLAVSGTSYAIVASGLLATPPVNEFVDAAVTGVGPVFYRIELEP
jgi:hypothetical protein